MALTAEAYRAQGRVEAYKRVAQEIAEYAEHIGYGKLEVGEYDNYHHMLEKLCDAAEAYQKKRLIRVLGLGDE